MPRTNNKTYTATGTNAPLALTIANAGTDRRLRVDLVSASVSGGTAVLTIEQDTSTPADGVTEVLWQDLVTSGAPYVLPLGVVDGLQSPFAGRDVVVKLAAAGTGNVGRVNAIAHPE